MSNPVLTKFEKDTRRAQVRQAPPPSPADLQRMYDQRSTMPPGYAPPAYDPNQQRPQPGTGFPPGGGGGFGGGWGGGGGGDGTPASRPMTIDDVVTRSAAMWAVLFVAAAATWALVGTASPAVVPLLIGSFIVTIGLSFYVSFRGKANAPLSIVFAVAEGVLVGAISKLFNDWYPGLVVQAVLATLVVTGVTFAAFKVTGFRASPKFTKWVVIGTFSVLGLALVNLLASFFIDGGLGLRDGGPLAIVFSLVCIGLAISNLLLDFDLINRSIEQGAPENTAWLASLGLMTTVVWLYIEILRLLSYFRN
ncbi:Bax inhibitor-1/YccA family protein [Jatrophihabitans sp. YIM 134969]